MAALTSPSPSTPPGTLVYPTHSSDTEPISRRLALTRPDLERLEAELPALGPRMQAVARGIVRDGNAAEDIVQNAFVKAIRGLPGFDGRARLSTWLHRIVVNESLMWLRSESRRRRRFELESDSGRDTDQHAAPMRDPVEPLIEHEQTALLHAGLAALPPAERDVLEHCALAGESYDEYASHRGIGSAAAKSRAFRARRHLRSWLTHA